MPNRPCPHCGHDNLERAVFCFQCGKNLDDPPIVRGIHRHRRHIEDAMRYVDGREDALEPELVKKLREAKAKLKPISEGTPLTCLRCGTLNKPQATYCIGCGAALRVPEDMHKVRLVPCASARSDVGRVRDNNEDRVGLWARHGIVLAMVADGMGGAVAGEEASRLVMEAVQADFLGEARGSEVLPELSEEEIAEKLRQAVRRANRAVIQQASQRPELQGMGTTITLAFIRDNRVIIAHVGDSRAYLVDGEEGWINQVTDDHSFVEALVSSGHITPEQAAIHPMRNVLYRALGQVEETDADLYSRNLADGDRFILCSDGLTRHVTTAELAEIAIDNTEPDAIAQALIDLANKRGGEDNISVVVVRMDRGEDVEPGERPAEILLNDTEVGLNQVVGEVDSDTTETQQLDPVDYDDSSSEPDSADSTIG